MFIGFNMILSKGDVYKYIDYGKNILNNDLNIIQASLSDYLIYYNYLSADKIMYDWFPQTEADVFISHSHKDLDSAYGLAGFLKQKYGLKSFIDSSVWGYANDLLKLIDDEYNVVKSDNKGHITYNYDKRNFSASHVHIMLNGALMRMMDKTECVFFLNTPNTIVFRDKYDKEFTDSPWIYSELLMTQLLRKKSLKEYRRQEVLAAKYDHLSILYGVPDKELYDITFYDLNEIRKISRVPYENLDELYKELGII